MRAPLKRVVPALFASLIVAIIPSCASIPRDLHAATAVEAREDARPARAIVLKPVVEGAPTCIQRGASMDFDPPECGEGMWPLLVFYLLVYIGYGIGWCFVALGELIAEACEPSHQEQKPEENPSSASADCATSE